jgi:hypothetical protein
MAVLCASAGAATATQDKGFVCMSKGGLFKGVASLRDQGADPTIAYARYTPNVVFDDASVKRFINLVYFDPRFTNAGGQALEQQINAVCLNDGKPQFQPLK